MPGPGSTSRGMSGRGLNRSPLRVRPPREKPEPPPLTEEEVAILAARASSLWPAPQMLRSSPSPSGPRPGPEHPAPNVPPGLNGGRPVQGGPRRLPTGNGSDAGSSG